MKIVIPIKYEKGNTASWRVHLLLPTETEPAVWIQLLIQGKMDYVTFVEPELKTMML
jgi:hypothetical protein